MNANYTAEQEARMKEVYEMAASADARDSAVLALMAEFDKTKASVIGKLSSMGIYVRKVRQDKTGAPVTSKHELVQAIKIFAGAREHELNSLEKATKQDLKFLIDMFTRMNDEFDLKG
jgi:hypothetical protein